MNDFVSELFPQKRPRKIYSVSEVNRIARETLENINVWVEGEISRCDKHPQFSFFYITLKDENAVLPCVIDNFVLEKLEGEPVGQKVLVHGFLSIYEPRGQYQLRIQYIEPAGEGLLRRKLEETIRRLRAEGLFDPKFKKEIPQYPKKVCIVTSHGSDAWNDFKRHTVDKFHIIELFTADVRVQGPQSISQLLKILPKLDKLDFDVIVITRGGGSLEDLAAFNDEGVARTIFAAKTPTVVAIGHEANESLAEWVADKRASTPTDAANIVTSGYVKAAERLFYLRQYLKSKFDYYYSTNFQKLDYIHFQLQKIELSFKDLPHKLATFKESLGKHRKYLIEDADSKVNELFRQYTKAVKVMLDTKDKRLSQLQHLLVLLSPKNVLGRGYSIATDSKGRVLKSVDSVVVGSMIGVRLVDGRLTSQVKSKEKNEKRF